MSRDLDKLTSELRETESAFAKTMAVRDVEAFASFLVPETIFFSGDLPLRGADAVRNAWSKFFDGPDAPFSWTPTVVEILDDGSLGITSGPVHDSEGNQIATFNSVWRRDPDGWKVIFDRGCSTCE